MFIIPETVNIINGFTNLYENHGLNVPGFTTRNDAILQADYSADLLENRLFVSDFRKLVPDFLRKHVKAPKRTELDLKETFHIDRRYVYELFQGIDMLPFFDMSDLFYKSMGSVFTYLKVTANSKNYTNTKHFQALFEEAIGDGVFGGLPNLPMVAVHSGVGLQEGLWFDMMRDKHDYDKIPTYTDGSVNMLRVCNAFHPEAKVQTSTQFDSPVLCIANNCVPCMPAESISGYVKSLGLKKGSIVFATAVTDYTDTEADYYYAARELHSSVFEELFFLKRKEVEKYVGFLSEGTGDEIRPKEGAEKFPAESFAAMFGPNDHHVINNIHMYARIRGYIPVPMLGRIPQINPQFHLYLTSSYRLYPKDFELLKKQGAEIVGDPKKEAVGLLYRL